MEKKEIRTICKEVRAAPDSMAITGYAALFDSWSEDLGGFREIIKKGAFTQSLKDGDDVRCLFNHDANYVMGRRKSGTLELAEDDTGLRFSVNMPETSWAKDLYESVRRGDIDQCSFGFMVNRDGASWKFVENGPAERTLISLKLFDVSVVTFPAYPETSAGIRALHEAQSRILTERAKNILRIRELEG